MTAYRFAVLDVAAEPYAVAPQLTARLRIEELFRALHHNADKAGYRVAQKVLAGEFEFNLLVGLAFQGVHHESHAPIVPPQAPIGTMVGLPYEPASASRKAAPS